MKRSVVLALVLLAGSVEAFAPQLAASRSHQRRKDGRRAAEVRHWRRNDLRRKPNCSA